MVNILLAIASVILAVSDFILTIALVRLTLRVEPKIDAKNSGVNTFLEEAKE